MEFQGVLICIYLIASEADYLFMCLEAVKMLFFP